MLSMRTAQRSMAGLKSVAMRPSNARRSLATRAITITEGVEFDTIAREWRLKWSADNDKKSLAAVQAILKEVEPQLKGINGLKSVQRVVCGGCLDFKVVTALSADAYGAWEAAKFAPEETFLSKVKAIPGVSTVETQTYTLMPVITK